MNCVTVLFEGGPGWWNRIRQIVRQIDLISGALLQLIQSNAGLAVCQADVAFHQKSCVLVLTLGKNQLAAIADLLLARNCLAVFDYG